MGDPGGVGPEVVAKVLRDPAVRKICIPIVLANSFIMERTIRLLGYAGRLREIASPEEAQSSGRFIQLIDPGIEGLSGIPQKRATALGGKASVSCIRKAVDFALRREVDAIVTAPISKESLKMAGFPWPGHTEMLAEFSRVKQYAMMLVGGSLRIILVTIHVPLRDVPRLLTRQKILTVIRLAKEACHVFGIRNPKIGVAGVNPHAGEAGMFGDEERKQILPAVRQAQREQIPVSGPYPPDTIFYRAMRGEFDIVVCMYHDQGLIPLKMSAFDKGVNVTIGLPFVRTSPDHGTAYDIAWEGRANPSSMVEAVLLAAKLAV